MEGTKILLATMQMVIGGAETHILELCKGLQKKGMKVYVASNGGEYEQELEASGVTHYKVPLHNKQPLNIISAYRTLKRIIVENDIRLVHAHARIPAFICGFLQRKLNFRFVTTAHWVFTTSFPYNLLSNWGEKSLAVSEDIQDYLINHYRMPKNDIRITINGIDTDKFSPNAEPAEKHRAKPCIMSISRLDESRSLSAHLLIESAPALLARYPNAVIYIVGDGDDYENVLAKAEAANKSFGRDVIKMVGRQTNIPGWLAMADVFVNVSRSVLEAMALGKPVIVSGNEGYIGLLNEESLPIAVETNFCARGCEEATAEKLTADLIKLLDMPSRERAALGNFNREFILANYSADRMADDAMELYRAVLSEASPVAVRKTDIMISGYYGYNNSGDDMLLKSIVRDLQAQQVDLSITVLSKRPRETREQYGVNAIYRFNFFAIWRLLRRTQLLLTGGGSLIQDYTSTQSLFYYLWIIRTARRFRVKNMIYGSGIGPIKNNAKLMSSELSKMDLITLREEDSRLLLEKHQVKAPEIIVTADPVFNLPPPDFNKAREELATLGIEPNQYVCISLRAFRYNPPGFERQIARFADYIAQTYNYTILYTPMQLSIDTEISQKAMSLMKQHAIFLETSHIRGIVGLSALTIAMRLHTLIYAINQGVPVIGLDYDPKVRGLMDTIGQPFCIAVEEAKSEILTNFADLIFADKEKISAEIKEAGQKAQALAEQNASLCMKLLKEG